MSFYIACIGTTVGLCVIGFTAMWFDRKRERLAREGNAK